MQLISTFTAQVKQDSADKHFKTVMNEYTGESHKNKHTMRFTRTKQ